VYRYHCDEAPVKGLHLVFLILLCSPLTAHTDDHPGTTSDLAQSPHWLRLLHYNADGSGSTIVDNSFFLAPEGNHNPRQELNALIKAYSQPWGNDPSSHPRCRFPARYYWLSKQISLPEYQIVPTLCARLKRWSVLRDTRSISMVFVSGYLGNPASIFGHGFLKLDTGQADDLFDQSVNYGALIPPREPTLRYVIKGLSGGYLAGFSDRYYYTQDMTYSHTEFRDMWTYELKLTEEQRRVLLLHLWEVLGRKKVYYFLNRNCVYELGKLLEVATDTSIVDNARVWYAPIELFDKLQGLDQKSGSIISDVHYIPSAERVLISRYASLNGKQRRIASDLLNSDAPHWTPGKENTISLDSQIEILNFVLAAQQFRYIKEQPEPSNETLERKRRILLQRLALPARKEDEITTPPLILPTDTAAPTIFGIGTGYSRRDEAFPLFGLSLFAREATGNNNLQGSELVLFDITLAQEDKLKLDRLDYFRIRKLTTTHLPLQGMDTWSWKASGSSTLESSADGDKYNHSLSFSIGKTIGSNRLSLTALTGGSVNNMSPTLSARPGVDLYAQLSKQTKLLAGTELARLPGKKHYAIQHTLNIQHAISRRFSIILKYNQNQETRWTAEARTHW